MKVLVDPVFTSQQTRKCASCFMLNQMVEVLLREIPDLFVYYVVPQKEEGYMKWTHDGIYPEGPRVKHVVLRAKKDRWREYYDLSDEWLKTFSFWGTHCDWDALLTNRVPAMQMFRMFTEKSMRGLRYLCGVDAFPIFSWKATVHGHEMLDASSLVNYLSADDVILNSSLERDEIEKTAHRHLAPYYVLEVMKRIHVKLLLNLDLDLDAPFRRRPQDFADRVRFCFTQRLLKQRRYELTFEVMRHLKITESNAAFTVTTNSMDGVSPRFDLDFVRLQYPSREEFYEILKTCCCFISYSVEEGVPAGLIESFAHGVFGIVNRRPWSEALLGPNYPFWVPDGNVDAGIELGQAVARDYPTAYKKFLVWYDSWFLPMLKDRSGAQQIVVGKIEALRSAHKTRMAKRGGATTKGSRDSLSWNINNRAELLGLKRINIYDEAQKMTEWGKTEGNFDAYDTIIWDHIPLQRSSDFNAVRLELMHLHGWRDTIEPLIMERG